DRILPDKMCLETDVAEIEKEIRLLENYFSKIIIRAYLLFTWLPEIKVSICSNDIDGLPQRFIRKVLSIRDVLAAADNNRNHSLLQQFGANYGQSSVCVLQVLTLADISEVADFWSVRTA